MASYNGQFSQSMLTSDDGNVSLLSGASDNTSIWDGSCDPASVQLRNMRKTMNKMARIFAKEYKATSRLPELEMADDGPDVDIKRSELVNAILGYINTGRILVSNGCGDQETAMISIADSIRTASLRVNQILGDNLHPRESDPAPCTNRRIRPNRSATSTTTTTAKDPSATMCGPDSSDPSEGTQVG